MTATTPDRQAVRAQTQAWAWQASAAAPWVLDACELLDQLPKPAPDARWQLRGERWTRDARLDATTHGTVGDDDDNARSPNDGAGRGVGAVALACSPSALAGEAATLERAGCAWLVTVDWPLPNRRPVDELAVAGHVAFLYQLGNEHATRFVERHQLAIVHPQYRGMLAAYVTAMRDVGDLGIEVTGSLAGCVVPHWAPGPLLAGQVRAIDIEIVSANVARAGVDGTVCALDRGVGLGPPMRLTLASSMRVSCTVSGDVDGPLPAEELERVSQLLLDGRVTATRAAAAIERAGLRTAAGPAWRPPGMFTRIAALMRQRLWGLP